MSVASSARADREAFPSEPSAADGEAMPIDAGEMDARHLSQETANAPETLAGERGASALHRARSLQSRASQVLALTLMSALAIGLLGWYYFHTFAARGTAPRTAQTPL